MSRSKTILWMRRLLQVSNNTTACVLEIRTKFDLDEAAGGGGGRGMLLPICVAERV